MRRRHHRRHRRSGALVTGLLAAGLLAAGCAADPPPAPPPPPPPVAAGPLAAADGQNVGTCLDGDCEVRVTGPVVLPVGAEFEVTNLRVEALEADRVRLAGEFPGGSVQGDNCSVAARSGSNGSRRSSLQARCSAGGQLTLEKITISVMAIGRDSAVLRIAPR